MNLRNPFSFPNQSRRRSLLLSVIASLIPNLYGQSLQSDDLLHPERHHLISEVWQDVQGDTVASIDVVLNEVPDQTKILAGETRRLIFTQEQDTHFARRIKGWFRAPETGDYTFHAYTSHSAAMWIEREGKAVQILTLEKPSPEGEWAKQPEQTSTKTRLIKGKTYPIELRVKAGAGLNYFALGITFPEGWTEFPIRVKRFEPVPEDISMDTDQDEDGLSEYQEWVMGTAPDRFSTAEDGISDLDKLHMGLDPLKKLSTPPALSVAWCREHRIPIDPQARWQDPDQDDLQNQDEYRLGFDPNHPDTSGDGINDGVAARILRMKPDQQLMEKDLIPVATIKGSAILSTQGVWKEGASGNSRHTVTTNGSATYRILHPDPNPLIGHLTLQLHHENKKPAGDIWVSMNLDSHEVSRQRIRTETGKPYKAWWVIPRVKEGIHDVTFQIENLDENLNVSFEKVNLFHLPNTPEGMEFLEQWKQDTLQVPPRTSFQISPACLEGHSILPQFLEINLLQKDSPQTFSAAPLPDERWYANLPLPADGTACSVQLKHLASHRQLETELHWSETNLFQTVPPYLRPGDSLRITAHPPEQREGQFRVNINGMEVDFQTVLDPVVQRFEEPGVYELEAEWKLGDETRNVQVSLEVLSPGEFSHSIITKSNEEAQWTVDPDDPKTLVLDRKMEVTRTGNTLQNTAKRTGSYPVMIRAGEKGPVLAHRRAEVFHVQFPKYTSTNLHPSGSDLRCYSVTLSRVPDFLHVQVRPNAPWLYMINGTKEQWWTREDFDGAGRLIYFFRPNRKGAKPWTPHRVFYKNARTP